MATVTKGKTFVSGETVTPPKLNDVVDLATVTEIVNADIKSDAAIAGTKISPNFGAQDVTIGEKLLHNNDLDTSVRFPSDDVITFETAGSERARVTPEGYLFFGTSVSVGVGGVSLFPAFSGGAAQIQWNRNSTTASSSVMIFRNAGAAVGSVAHTNTTTTYNTSSDYRLKQNVEPMVGGLAKLAELKPSTFEFKVEPGVKVDGFIAHEVQAVVPQAVTGEKDGEEMQGLDHGKLVPVLVAAVQELSAKVAAFEAAQNQ